MSKSSHCLILVSAYCSLPSLHFHTSRERSDEKYSGLRTFTAHLTCGNTQVLSTKQSTCIYIKEIASCLFTVISPFAST